MNLHEYQAKEILQAYGLPIPDFGVAHNMGDVAQIMKDLDLSEAIVKIQVHAGGRGKAGGVKFAKTPDSIKEIAGELIGMKMVNNQTGPQGVIANCVMIARPVDIAKEFYLGAVIDRENACAILIASKEGGMEIEEVAQTHPEKILKLPLPLSADALTNLCAFMGWSGDLAEQGKKIGACLASAFLEKDGDLLEINPLVETGDGKLWCVDAKLSVDDNALFRHPEIAKMYDPTQVSAQESAAKQFDLAYIALDGNIGCMVNGAGLAMATMDIIQYYGGKPANFLDVGGSATQEIVAAGFKIILEDPKVQAILVNIFGGIMSCATIARGIIEAVGALDVKVPLVVRLEGTNVDEGRRLLVESGLKIVAAESLDVAAQKAVEVLGGNTDS